ncbi:MAG: sulfite exporter TauE/SafE family protein [Thermodesulfobacteriota bacterium]
MIIITATGIVFFLAFIFSMLGLGGAMLYVPVFHWLGFGFKGAAVPTALLLNGITAATAAVIYHQNRMIDYKGSFPLILSSFLGAPCGAYLTKFIPTETLILFFALAMLFAGGRMLVSSGETDRQEMVPLPQRLVFMSAGGFGIGLIAGMLGIGGGFLFVPLMLLLGYPTKNAAATSSFVVIFSSFSGFAGHVAGGHFNVLLMLATTMAVIAGALAGAYIMREKMKPGRIKLIFGLVLLGVGMKMFLGILV